MAGCCHFPSGSKLFSTTRTRYNDATPKIARFCSAGTDPCEYNGETDRALPTRDHPISRHARC